VHVDYLDNEFVLTTTRQSGFAEQDAIEAAEVSSAIE